MMTSHNPYERPRAESGTSGELTGVDDADLFVQTLPPPAVRLTAGAALVLGILTLVLGLRLLLATTGALAHLLQVGHVVLGLLCFFVAGGLWRGSVVRAFLGLGLMPVALAASAFAALTGSLGGLFGAALALLTFALLLVSLGPVRKMGQARRALALRQAGAR